MKIQFTMILVVAAACCSTLRADMAKKDLAPAPIPVTVVAGNATNRYNLAVVSDDGDVKGAKAYIDAYADNVQFDAAFKANEAQALAAIRTETKCFGTWWAMAKVSPLS